MSVYETGFNKGEEILSECDKGRRWTDRMNDVSVEREIDPEGGQLYTFCVTERLRGNLFHTWASGMTLPAAFDLAERLVVGKDYLPPKRVPTKKPFVFVWTLGITCGAIVEGYELIGEISRYYQLDRGTLMEAPYGARLPEVRDAHENHAVIVSTYFDNPTDTSPSSVGVVFKHDGKYWYAILRKSF